MKPSFNILKKHYYSANKDNSNFAPTYDVYAEIGYDAMQLLQSNPEYGNTCAVRLSLALIKSGVKFHGRFLIKSGDFKCVKIETGAKLLADQLHRPGIFGRASIFHDVNTAKNGMKNKKGVVFFNKITGYGGGHVDLH